MLPLWPLLLLAQVVLGQFWMEEIVHEGKSPYDPKEHKVAASPGDLII
jgi:hypothetical protein